MFVFCVKEKKTSRWVSVWLKNTWITKKSAGWLWIMIDKEWLFKKRWVGNWCWSENEIKLNPKVIQQFLSVRYDGAHTHYYCTVMLMDAFCYAVTWGLSKWGFKMTSFTSLSIASTSSIGGRPDCQSYPLNHRAETIKKFLDCRVSDKSIQGLNITVTTSEQIVLVISWKTTKYHSWIF